MYNFTHDTLKQDSEKSRSNGPVQECPESVPVHAEDTSQDTAGHAISSDNGGNVRNTTAVSDGTRGVTQKSEAEKAKDLQHMLAKLSMELHKAGMKSPVKYNMGMDAYCINTDKSDEGPLLPI